MKKMLLFTLILSALAISVDAQVLTRVRKDSAVNAGTKFVNVGSTTNNTTGIFLSGLKSSGTVSGYAVLQVVTDTLPTAATSVYEDFQYPGTGKRDTLFFTDVTTIQQHTWPIPFNFFNRARLKITTTGTQKLYLYAGSIKR